MTTRILLALALSLAAGCTEADNGAFRAIGEAPLPDVGDDDTGRVGEDADDATPEPDAPEPDVPEPQGCSPEECEIDGECVANEAPNPDNPCEICLVFVDALAWTPDDAAVCDDGDPCTQEDACAEGECVGEVVTCDDGDPCTEDLCDAESGECDSAPAADGASCEDGDPCSLGDVCLAGLCTGGNQALACDDGNGCTADRCETGVGCVAEPTVGVACDDENPCTVGDLCGDAGQCVPGTGELECDDENLCTVDACDPASGCVYDDISDLCADENGCTDEACDPERGCVYPFNTNACDDANLCTDGDVCTQGSCRGAPINLDDMNLCTDVTCDPEGGVMVAFNNLPCDDADACTVQDACGSGACQPGAPRVCDDENVCTDNDCDSGQGCVFTNNTDRCDDEDICTVQDSCADGECAGSPRNCDDGNPCTRDRCDPEFECVNTAILSNVCRPIIDVAYPPRAATLQDENPVVVRGTVASGAGDIVSFTINGQEVALDGENFALPLVPEVGGNMLVIESRDAIGNTNKVVQSFLWSTEYREPHNPETREGAVEEGLGIWLSQAVLDDDDRSDPPNDFAHIFELVLATYDLEALIDPNLGSFSGITVTMESLNHAAPQVRLRSGDDVLNLHLNIPNINAGLRARGFLINATGSLTADSITVDAEVRLRVVNHQLVVEVDPNNVDVSVNNPTFRFNNGILNFLVGWLVNSVLPGIISDVEAGLRTALIEQIEPILQDALGALALDSTLALPSLAGDGETQVRLITDYSSVDVRPAGMELGFRAGAYSPPGIDVVNRGAMARVGCGEGPQRLIIPSQGEAEMVLTDDLLNQLLYSAWRGGWLDFPVPTELLGDFDFEGLGITNVSLDAFGLLQPTASDCNADGELLLTLGDLRIDASLELFGEPVEFAIYASLQAGLSLTAQEGQIGLGLTSIERVDQQIVIEDERFLSLEPVVEGLIGDNLVPALLEVLGGDALGGFPIPAVDIGGAIDGFDGELFITIEPLGLERIDGNSVVDARLGSQQ